MRRIALAAFLSVLSISSLFGIGLVKSQTTSNGNMVSQFVSSAGNPVNVSAANPLPVNASIMATATTTCTSTAAAPSYMEADPTSPISCDLAGNIRTLATASTAARATAAAPSYTEGNLADISQNLTGDLRTIAKQSGAWTVAQSGAWTVAATQSGAWTVAATQSGAWNVTNAGTFAVQAAQSGTWNVSNVGTFATQAAQSGTWTVQPGNTANTTAWLVTGTGGTFPATQSGSWTVQPGNTANTTAWLVTGTGGTFPATQSGTWTVQPGNTANTTPWLVTPTASAAGGCTLAKALSAASTNGTNIKSSAGTLCSVLVINTTSALYYLKFYNTSGTPTCNSDTVVQSIPIPHATGNGAGVSVNVGPFGWAFTTGISFCLTGGLADNDNTNAATGVAISYSYK